MVALGNLLKALRDGDPVTLLAVAFAGLMFQVVIRFGLPVWRSFMEKRTLPERAQREAAALRDHLQSRGYGYRWDSRCWDIVASIERGETSVHELRVHVAGILQQEAEHYEVTKARQKTVEENSEKWARSGQPEHWVNEHQGQWNHDDWVALLNELRNTPFWPMEETAIARTVEEHKSHYWCPASCVWRNDLEGLRAQRGWKSRTDLKRDLGLALYLATVPGRIEFLRTLLELGVDANGLSNGDWGAPAILAAADHGNTDAVRVLLEHGANPNVRAKHIDGDTGGLVEGFSTPLSLARKIGKPEIVNMLLEKGAH